MTNTYNSAAIRNLLIDATTDQTLNALCFDHFRAVSENFSDGMDRLDKIQRLLEYCQKQRQFETLLSHIQRLNPRLMTITMCSLLPALLSIAAIAWRLLPGDPATCYSQPLWTHRPY